MTSLFCNLLDNALEASRYIPNSFIELSIHQKPETAFTVIALVNSCRESPFSGTDKRLKTSKENKTLHGHGGKNYRKSSKSLPRKHRLLLLRRKSYISYDYCIKKPTYMTHHQLLSSLKILLQKNIPKYYDI